MFLILYGHSTSVCVLKVRVNRLEMIGIDRAWSRRCPGVWDWFRRIRERPSYGEGLSDHVTEDDIDRMRPVDGDAADQVIALFWVLRADR